MSAPEALPPPTLWARSLTVIRGGRTLFSDLSFALNGGDLLLLLGPNGAGKTSLLLTLAGALHPAGGMVDYTDGGASEPHAALIHLVLLRPGIKPRLTVGENLGFWRTLNGRTGLDVAAALDRVGLGGLEEIEAGHLSTGQTQRLSLARLLVTERPIWLLDEPSAGLDEAGEALLRTMLVEHAAKGGMAVVATHAAGTITDNRTATTLTIVSGGVSMGSLL